MLSHLRLGFVASVLVGSIVGSLPGVAPAAAAGSACVPPPPASDMLRVVDAPFVALAPSPCGRGYALLDLQGGLFTFGDARFHGSVPGLREAGQVIPNPGVVDLAPSPGGAGYYVLDRQGGVFTFGDARFHGSVPGLRQAGHPIPMADVVNIAVDPGGSGYLVLDVGGGIFAFGDARYHGSLPALRQAGALRRNVAAVDLASAGDGYVILDIEGGVAPFGAASFRGDLPSLRAQGVVRGTTPATAVAAAPGGGYWVLDRDGGVFAFGADFHGSASGREPGVPALDLAASPGGRGYWVLFANGAVHAFGDAAPAGSLAGSELAPGAYVVREVRVEGRPRSPGQVRGLTLAYDVYRRVNDERAARGLAALAWDPSLARLSEAWSIEMSRTGIRHGGYRLLDPADYPAAGENVAMGAGPGAETAGFAHSRWMASDGHRVNVLNPGFDAVGIGVYCGPNGMFATQVFGRSATSDGPAVTTAVPPRDPVAHPDGSPPACR